MGWGVSISPTSPEPKTHPLDLFRRAPDLELRKNRRRPSKRQATFSHSSWRLHRAIGRSVHSDV